MRYRPSPFARQWHQFKRQADALNQALADGSFATWSVQKQERIKEKLIRAYHQLKVYFSITALKRALAGAAILLGLHTNSVAQDFAPPVLNPFNLSMSSGDNFANPTLVDLDDDGDLDLLSDNAQNYTGRFLYFENTGTATAPDFAAPIANPFGLSQLPQYQYQFSALGDMDGDGDYDIVGLRAMGTMYYYENTGTAQLANFAAPQINPFTFPGSPAVGDSMYFFPELADMDGDGDLDLFVGNLYDAKVRYFENTGTATSPAFPAGVSMPFNMPFNDFLYITNLTTGDVDKDGDLDIMVSASYDNYGSGGTSIFENRFYYFENNGTPTAPSLTPTTTVNPFGLSSVGYYFLFSELADLDSDGDLDLLSGAADTIPNSYYYNINFYYFENVENPVGQEQLLQAPFQVYPNPAHSQLNVAWPTNDFQSGHIELFDAMGKAVLRENIVQPATTHSIAIQHLPPGMYWLRLTYGDKIATQQFVKQ